MAQFKKIAAVICLVMLSVYGALYAEDDGEGGQGDVGGSVSDESNTADVSDAGDTQVEVNDTENTYDAQVGENDAGNIPDERREVVETNESYEESSITYPGREKVRVIRPAVTGVSVGTRAITVPRGASAGFFNNTKIPAALAGNKITIGMTKEALIDQIGYPPDGTIGQGALFSSFIQSKATVAGKEESWTYRISTTAAGVKSVTFDIVDGKVIAWNEWLDKSRK